ncbi:MAG: phosphate transporter substrate-binding protein [Chloroflexi bacterium]|nr:phosphate transporter substrate-binding protein [Chloroflexota bacterium]
MFFNGKGRKFSLTLMSFLLVTLLLAACGEATNTAAPAASTAPASATTAAAGATTAAAASAGASTSAAATPSNSYKVSANVTLSGSGASFPDKAYQKWIANFATANPSVKLSYKSVGSGTGRKAFFAGEVDFAGSDAYPSRTETENYGKPIVTIPTTISGVTLAYNLPGVTGLRLSPEILGGLYTGRIARWNDAAIKAENPSATLPDTAITFAVRSDSSGTSDIFSNYLAAVSPEFKALGIAGSQPEWGKGGIQITKGEQNPGVATAIKQNVGMIGYVDFGDAVAQNLVFADLKNAAGQYVKPSPESFSQAEPAGGVPDNLQLKVANSANPKAYPITSTTWIILPKDMKDKDKAEALITFLWWVTHDQQQIGAVKELGFAALPASVLPKIESTLKSITANGQPVLK